MAKDEKKKKEVKIEDKRRFTAEGKPKDPKQEPKPKEEAKKEKGGEKAPPMPPIDFTSFVLSFASSAQVHMGLLPNPVGKKTEKNLDLAKQTIDVLGLLEEKTKGNLKENEDRILKDILHNLRLQFVEVKKQ